MYSVFAFGITNLVLPSGPSFNWKFFQFFASFPKWSFGDLLNINSCSDGHCADIIKQISLLEHISNRKAIFIIATCMKSSYIRFEDIFPPSDKGIILGMILTSDYFPSYIPLLPERPFPRKKSPLFLWFFQDSPYIFWHVSEICKDYFQVSKTFIEVFQKHPMNAKIHQGAILLRFHH